LLSWAGGRESHCGGGGHDGDGDYESASDGMDTLMGRMKKIGLQPAFPDGFLSYHEKEEALYSSAYTLMLPLTWSPSLF